MVKWKDNRPSIDAYTWTAPWYMLAFIHGRGGKNFDDNGRDGRDE